MLSSTTGVGGNTVKVKNREQRIADAEFKVMGLKLVLDPLQKQLNDAEVELNRAKASYDFGERVHVEETCRRGCCTENEYDGTITGVQKNGSYIVKSDDGHVYEYVSTYDMKRVNEQRKANR